MNLNYAALASQLEAWEAPILQRLIERAQFACNDAIYDRNKPNSFIQDRGSPHRTLLDLRLHYTEQVYSLFGRFTVPHECPFFPSDAEIGQSCVTEGRESLQKLVNLSYEIKEYYQAFLPQLCQAGDDGQYDYTTEKDCDLLFIVARRIHFGSLYIGEAKYQAQPTLFQSAIDISDSAALEQLITQPVVEEKTFDRIQKKALILQSGSITGAWRVVAAEILTNFFRTVVIPLTKKGQVICLLQKGARL
ncbi:MAG: hypothetical protein JW795_07785 [Chitinivibrionales bacterium]|nr:hypothetical protein [Chitinivibrionales bacterium]